MPTHVRIDQPELLPDLINSFLRSGCIAQPVGNSSCIVVHVDAEHAGEAWREVIFFVRSWEIRHPDVAAVVTC
jgi:hypothetical protein